MKKTHQEYRNTLHVLIQDGALSRRDDDWATSVARKRTFTLKEKKHIMALQKKAQS